MNYYKDLDTIYRQNDVCTVTNNTRPSLRKSEKNYNVKYKKTMQSIYEHEISRCVSFPPDSWSARSSAGEAPPRSGW